jgi:hypothetical protein
MKPKTKKLVCFGVSNLYRNNGNKQNRFETKRNNPKLSEKNTKVSNCFVALLFVSVQLKHRNSLFQYRSETTETNILFQKVPKLVLVPVSVVLNQN